ncbi:MAG: phosphoribosylamine--glycine ligase, partial [Deltaproteobacteria bacterium]|nr:phosphoribosylamine--glycine ligase [Deltaproteobacteria bacterium]
MKILIVGGGGREHSLAWKLSASKKVTRLFASPGSDAIAGCAECVALNGNTEIVEFARREKIDLTVVGPEAPLVDGLADEMAAAGLKVFGPSAAAARLEGSKVFAKEFMDRNGIPSAPFGSFDNVEDARRHLETMELPLVIKADGLAAGKGVIICHTSRQAHEALDRIMVEQAFGGAGSRVVIEGFLRGEEASFFVITDGKDFIAFPPCQDHKPIGDLDTGPNTGGMGAYCPAPVVTPEVERLVVEQVVRPTLQGMAAEGHPYTGVLYVGLMIHQGQPAVVEYNCRFGDPECQPLMMMLESDLADLLLASVEGRLGEAEPRWSSGAAVCVVMASGGYPEAYAKGHIITGLENAPQTEGLMVFHAGTRRDPGTGSWSNNGGRVLGVTARQDTLGSALEVAYNAVA